MCLAGEGRWGQGWGLLSWPDQEPSEPPVLRQGGFWGYKLEVHVALWNPRTPNARVEGTLLIQQ